MKKYLFLLFLILYPGVASAALNAATNWELRAAGNDTNGGGFAVGVQSIASRTDLVVDGTDNKKVTSATRVFASDDAGRFIQVTAGTGFKVGYYKIVSVTGSTATLAKSPAAVGTTGGSFTIYRGLDYSQQDAKNTNGSSNGSSVLASAAGSTTLTCADCLFTQDIVGNVVYVSGGTGSITAQRRAITAYTNATTVTMDASIASSTGMTLNIGGAVASLDEVFNSSRGIVASNTIWWKKGSGISSANLVSSSIGGGRLLGYNTTRGDLDQLIASSNRPTLTFTGTAGYALTLSSGNWQLRNFTINASSGSGANGINTTGTIALIHNVKVSNYDGIGIILAGSGQCSYCEVTGGTSNATKGISVVNSGIVKGSYVHDGNGVGIGGTSIAILQNNIVANMAGATADCFQMTAPVNNPPLIQNNTGYNCGRTGINIQGVSSPTIIIGNILMNNGAYGIALSTNSTAGTFQDGNAFYGNASGTKSNMEAYGQGSSNPVYDVANDIILSGDPFVNAAGGNFALNATSGAGALLRDSGFPRAWGTATTGYNDFGAVGHQDPGATVIQPNCSF